MKYSGEREGGYLVVHGTPNTLPMTVSAGILHSICAQFPRYDPERDLGITAEINSQSFVSGELCCEL